MRQSKEARRPGTVIGLLAAPPRPPLRPGRSMGSLACALGTFLTSHGLAMATDQTERLAIGRRRCRILAVPDPLRPSVEAFVDFMILSRERPRRAGTLPRTDAAIEAALVTVCDLPLCLAGKRDLAPTDVHDLKAFLAGSPRAPEASAGAGRTVLPLRTFPEDRPHRSPPPRSDHPRTERPHRCGSEA